MSSPFRYDTYSQKWKLFQVWNMKEDSKRCRKCLVKFEPEDIVTREGTKSRSKYYHQDCHRRY